MTITPDVKSHLFFSVTLVTSTAIVGEGLHRMSGVSDAQAILMALAVSLVGVIVWVIGRVKSKPVLKKVPTAENEDVECPHEGPLTFFKQPQYWGGILSLGGLVLVIYTVVSGKPPPKPVVPPPVAKRPVVRFPDLTLQGLTLNASNSSAVINGRVVHLGKWVEGVQVTGIDAEGVSVVLDGQTNRIHLTR